MCFYPAKYLQDDDECNNVILQDKHVKKKLFSKLDYNGELNEPLHQQWESTQQLVIWASSTHFGPIKFWMINHFQEQ